MKYSSLCYTLGSCFIFLKSTLYSMVCIWQSHTPKLLLFLYAVKLCLLRMLIHDFWVGNRLLSTSSPLKSVPACMHAKSLRLCPTLWDPWTVAHRAALSMGFSRPEYWSGLPCPPPGDLLNPGIEPTSPASEADYLPLSHQGRPVEGLFCARYRTGCFLYIWSHLILPAPWSRYYYCHWFRWENCQKHS